MQFNLRFFFDLHIDFSLMFVAELTFEGRLRWILFGVIFLELINNRLFKVELKLIEHLGLPGSQFVRCFPSNADLYRDFRELLFFLGGR